MGRIRSQITPLIFYEVKNLSPGLCALFRCVINTAIAKVLGH
jgi:hypothetical protein